MTHRLEPTNYKSTNAGLAAVGVIYKDSRGRTHRASVRPKGEVILSAGAIGSPQLLLLSGVGPSADLSSRRIPVVRPQPNVGKFMADNPRNNIIVVVPFTLDPSFGQAVAIAPEFYVETLSSITTFASLDRPSALLGNLTSPVDLSLAYFANKVPGPASTDGFLTLASSSDVGVSPNVRFNYFSDPADLAVCVKGVRKIGDILSTQTLAPYKFDNRDVRDTNGFKYFGPPLPADYRTNNVSLENFCRTTITTWWHYHGGCVAGKVVDGDFRFIGINALRVVDGSIFTYSPGTNPQATVMMMGRYVNCLNAKKKCNYVTEIMYLIMF